MIFKKFVPNKVVKNIFEIKPETLKKDGIRGIVVDLDNTLVPWNVANATEEVKRWLENMELNDIKVGIVSNNNKERVEIFSKPLNCPFIAKANKPLTGAFKKIKRKMGLSKNEIIVVGDQLLTDIFGGNRAGLKTVLVSPLVETDAPITKFNRRIERFIMRNLKKRNLIKWED